MREHAEEGCRRAVEQDVEPGDRHDLDVLRRPRSGPATTVSDAGSSRTGENDGGVIAHGPIERAAVRPEDDHPRDPKRLAACGPDGERAVDDGERGTLRSACAVTLTTAGLARAESERRRLDRDEPRARGRRVTVSGRLETLRTRERPAPVPAGAVPRAERRATSARRRPRPRRSRRGRRHRAPAAVSRPGPAVAEPTSRLARSARRGPAAPAASSAAAPATAAAAALVPFTGRERGLAVAGARRVGGREPDSRAR